MPDMDGVLDIVTEVTRTGGAGDTELDTEASIQFDANHTLHPFVGFGNYHDFCSDVLVTVDHYDTAGHLIWSDNR